MKKRLFVLGVLLLGFLGFTQESQVSFIIKNFGINVDGHFNRHEIQINRDADGNISDIKGTVYVSTIETGIESRDEHLLEEDYFDALSHPEITLESTSILPINQSDYKITANLNIKGKTKPITFKGSLSKDDIGTKFQTEFEINRRDFDVGGGGVLGKAVKVLVTYYFKS
ncbi:MAG: YceI family protein [Bacteroidota bacterium]